MLAEATSACLRGWQGREGRDVVIVGTVSTLGLQSRGAGELAEIVDVESRRVGGEDQRLGRQGVDERGGVDGAGCAGWCQSWASNGGGSRQ